jgi:hypothetical protein
MQSDENVSNMSKKCHAVCTIKLNESEKETQRNVKSLINEQIQECLKIKANY